MNGPNFPLGRILLGVAVVAFAGGAIAAGWQAAVAAPSTHAGLFGAPVLDLILDGEHGVDAFLGSPNLAPGDTLRGTLVLRMDTALDRDFTDLDLDARGAVHGWKQGPRIDEALHFRHLVYGRDDLLSSLDGGRDFVREIDASRVFGNGDGKLSLRELEAGANDLPAPERGGTPLVVHLAYEPDPGSQYIGQRLNLAFVFRLGDRMDADLN